MAKHRAIGVVNADLAAKIDRDAHDNPASPYRGKSLGIAEGQVIAFGDYYEEVKKHMSRLFQGTETSWIVFPEAGLHTDEVVELSSPFWEEPNFLGSDGDDVS